MAKKATSKAKKVVRGRPKITVVGSGNVGANCAVWAASHELGDIVLLDISAGIPQGKGLDLYQAAPVEGFDCKITGTNSYRDTAKSDVVIITAGLARTPGMSRDDLLKANTKIVKTVTENVCKYSPNTTIIVVSNPLDVMCFVAKKVSGFPANRVFGQAGILDSARFRAFLSMELNVSVEDIQAMVLGGHGDSMVPLLSCTTVGGIPISKLIEKSRLQEIVQRTRMGGGEIVKLLKKGSAYYAPAAASVQMAEAVLKDKKRVIPCSAWLTGEFGIKNIYCGVPIVCGAGGVEKIIEEIPMTKTELKALRASAEHVRAVTKKLKI